MKTLYKNAKIFTANDEALYADAMVVENGVITAIGEESQCGPADEVVDLEGKRVLPGLIDAHMHGLMLAGYSQQISALPPKINSIADLSEAIKEVAATKEPGDWIRGYASEEYAEFNKGLMEMTNRLTAGISEEAYEHLERIFVDCSRFETGFWDMAWNYGGTTK